MIGQLYLEGIWHFIIGIGGAGRRKHIRIKKPIKLGCKEGGGSLDK